MFSVYFQLILAACSSYFEDIMAQLGSEREPVIILRETSYSDLCAILEFMYYGEARVAQCNLKSVLATAEALKIKGLADVSGAAVQLPSKDLKPECPVPNNESPGMTLKNPKVEGSSDPKEDDALDADGLRMALDELADGIESEGIGLDYGEGDDSIGGPSSSSQHGMNNGENGEGDVLAPAVSFSEGSSFRNDLEAMDHSVSITLDGGAGKKLRILLTNCVLVPQISCVNLYFPFYRIIASTNFLTYSNV